MNFFSFEDYKCFATPMKIGIFLSSYDVRYSFGDRLDSLYQQVGGCIIYVYITCAGIKFAILQQVRNFMHCPHTKH